MQYEIIILELKDRVENVVAVPQEVERTDDNTDLVNNNNNYEEN